jgi:hypothetical protein
MSGHDDLARALLPELERAGWKLAPGAIAAVLEALDSHRRAQVRMSSARELINLLRFRRLDRRNGAISGNESAVRFCGEVADVLERLMELTP